MRAGYLIHRICLLSAFVLMSPMAHSQAGPPGLKAAVDAAWQRSPQARTLEAGRDESDAGREAAQSWIAGSPSVGLSQRSDRWTNRNGVRETDISLSAPFWLPGQKSARQALARTSADDLEARIASARLAIAGDVRERLWAVAAAREALTEVQDHQQHLEGLLEEVSTRVRAGDLARSDELLARQEVMAAQGTVAAAQAKLQEARTRFTALTGLPEIPAPEPETLAAQAGPHPRLLAARTSLDRAQAAHKAVTATRSDPPTVGVSLRREQESFGGGTSGTSGNSGNSHSVGIAIQIPLGTNARNRPLETAALTQIQTAAAESAEAEAVLQGEVELARRQLATAEQAVGTAEARAAVMHEHTRLIEKAFRLGERGLAELLRSEALSHEADVAVHQQHIAVGLARARLNQAFGVIP
jgi:cobalt-zinc-cadmium efflux system outer membrane protein